MSIRATIVGQITCQETLDTGVDASTTPTIAHNAFNFSHTVNATTTITGTKISADNQALTAGAYTLDLTACAKSGGTTQTLTGLKMRAYLFRAPLTNTGVIVITKGASNGLTVGGTALWKEALQPGDKVVKWLDDGGETIDGTHKTLDVTGTGAETFDYEIIVG